jgi:predicted dehydrogenase
MNKAKVGVVGCGNICGIYFKNLKRLPFLEVAACADLMLDRAKAKAAEFGIPKACTPDELLADPDISVVLNITIPKAHFDVAATALKAGKSVYNEKPLAIRREDGKKLVETAKKKNLRLGCAPDTFLGAGLQTCRKLIDEGAIGEPMAVTAFMVGGGPEGWHPDPAFVYQVGGGPLFDMGPYYLTALVTLLGPVKRVAGMARAGFPERIVGSGPKKGERIKVEVPTHVVGLLEFGNGAIANLITSFDARGGANLPRIEIYGSEGSLSVPDPNTFGGPVRLHRKDAKEWEEVKLAHGYEENSRAIGLADMVKAQAEKRAQRVSGELAFHVLDLMHAMVEASEERKHLTIKSSCERPLPLPLGLKFGDLD